jgi:hypothetical protein
MAAHVIESISAAWAMATARAIARASGHSHLPTYPFACFSASTRRAAIIAKINTPAPTLPTKSKNLAPTRHQNVTAAHSNMGSWLLQATSTGVLVQLETAPPLKAPISQ